MAKGIWAAILAGIAALFVWAVVGQLDSTTTSGYSATMIPAPEALTGIGLVLLTLFGIAVVAVVLGRSVRVDRRGISVGSRLR